MRIYGLIAAVVLLTLILWRITVWKDNSDTLHAVVKDVKQTNTVNTAAAGINTKTATNLTKYRKTARELDKTVDTSPVINADSLRRINARVAAATAARSAN